MAKTAGDQCPVAASSQKRKVKDQDCVAPMKKAIEKARLKKGIEQHKNIKGGM